MATVKPLLLVTVLIRQILFFSFSMSQHPGPDRDSSQARHTTVEIGVPNGGLISKEVRSLTLSDNATRIELLAGVAYGSNPHEVLEALHRATRENEFVFSDPEPLARDFANPKFPAREGHKIRWQVRVRSEALAVVSQPTT